MKIFISGNLESETISIATYYKFSSNELTDEEVLTLAEKVGTFDFLDAPEEDIYTVNDGKEYNKCTEKN